MAAKAPAVAKHIANAYFDESMGDSLTEERVRKCSTAAVGLFRWSGRTTARVLAALDTAESEKSSQYEQFSVPATPILHLQTDLCRLCQDSADVKHLTRTRFFWDPALSDSDLLLSDNGRTISSGENVLMKAAFGTSILPRHDQCSLSLMYNRGTQVYLVAGICQEGCMQTWDEQGSFRNMWENGRHTGCWLYSFFYNSLSGNGSDWPDMPAENGTKFQAGDELIIDFNRPPGTLMFSHKRQGHSCQLPLGSFTGLTAAYRVIALLGQCNQSVSIV